MRLLDLGFYSLSELRAVFGFSHPGTSQVALHIRLHAGGHNRKNIFDEIIKIIEVVRYYYNYEHCPECSRSQLMAIVSRCRSSVPVTFGATAVTVKIRDPVIEGIAEEDVFLKKSLFNVEAEIHAGLPLAHLAVLI